MQDNSTEEMVKEQIQVEQGFSDYKIVFVDRILDPVHGFIDLTKVEQEIVNLAIFKRLQSIKQLSMTNWVFPGAEHTRYMHSLGVMHIADQMAIHMLREDKTPLFTDADRQKLRLAGLLHDIGHYPLSHVTESVYLDTLEEEDIILDKHRQDTIGRIEKIIDYEIIDGKKKQKNLPEYMKSRYSKKRHHETMGTEVIKSSEEIKKIIKENCPFIEIKDICDIIVGRIEITEDEKCKDESKGKLAAMVQIIHSEVDADGIDYIMRDASFSGTTYGGFELGILLRNLRICEKNGFQIVGIRPKGISAVDQYLMSKYFSYTQVIFNRHVMILDKMAEILTKTFIRARQGYPDGIKLKQYLDQIDINDNYLKYTDRFFWSALDSMQESQLMKTTDENIIPFLKNFSKYQELSSVGELLVTSNKPEEVHSRIVKSDIYKNLISGNSERFAIFESRGFTNEIKEADYIQRYEEMNGTDGEEKAKLMRLFEGVPVIEENGGHNTITGLIVDDPRSLMFNLYDTKTYILREYSTK